MTYDLNIVSPVFLGQTTDECATVVLKNIQETVQESQSPDKESWSQVECALRLTARCQPFSWTKEVNIISDLSPNRHGWSLLQVVEHSLRPWIGEASRGTIYDYGRLLGSFFAYLLSKWQKDEELFCQILSWSLDSAEAFEHRIAGQLFGGTPQRFLKELFSPIWQMYVNRRPSAKSAFFRQRLGHLCSKFHLPCDFGEPVDVTKGPFL